MFLWYQIEMNIQLSLSLGSYLLPSTGNRTEAGVLAVPSGENQGLLSNLHIIHMEEISDPLREVV